MFVQSPYKLLNLLNLLYVPTSAKWPQFLYQSPYNFFKFYQKTKSKLINIAYESTKPNLHGVMSDYLRNQVLWGQKHAHSFKESHPRKTNTTC